MKKDGGKKDHQSNFAYDFLLAGISASIGKTATAPMERVKLILQNQHTVQAITDPYKGIIDCFTRLIKKEGFLSLWRGNIANVVRYFPSQAMNFAFKDTFRSLFNRNYDPNKDLAKLALMNCLSGGLAGSISMLICHPIDLARTRMATDILNKEDSRQFKGSIDCLKKIYRHEGIIGWYRGIVVSIVGIFAYRGAYFGGYDTIKGRFLKKNSNFFVKWFVAQCVTIASGMMFYPLDTIRRRIMIESGKPFEQKIYRNAVHCMFKMFHEERIFGFYKGFGMNAIRTGGSSIVLVLYDEFHKLFGLTTRGEASSK